MDDIIAIVIFIGMVAISVISKKISEKKKLEEENQAETVESFDELEDTVRRVLLGDPDIKTATPKRPPTATPPPVETVRTAEPERPASVPARQIPRPVLAPQEDPRMGRPSVGTPPPPPPIAYPLPQSRPKPVRVQRPQPPVQQPRPRPAGVPAKAQRPAPRPVVRQAIHGAAGKAGKMKSGRSVTVALPYSEPTLHSALHNRSRLAQAIVLKEILGAPKAFDY
ncbi:MAG: hypothetical protein GX117_04960 [Candidatus Hydrogenedentes bacterium]|jgi:hypothetical protein|nr:hypothetical protein [Candidatus Hydrogenedentota bacterium]